MYKVEYFDGFEWILRSWHQNRENANINAEVAAQTWSSARVIHEGKIVNEIVKQPKNKDKQLIKEEANV